MERQLEWKNQESRANQGKTNLLGRVIAFSYACLWLLESTVALESIDRGSDSAPLNLFWTPVQSYLHPQDPSTQARALPSSPIKGYMEVTPIVFTA